jgi:hypothetical protein
MNKMNGRRRKNKITLLMNGEEKIEGDKNLLAYATDFYKTLFGPSERARVGIDFEFTVVVDQEDNENLIKLFYFQEIKGIVFSLAYNKSPGPDGFPGEFYQFFWDCVKVPLKQLFDDFMGGKLDVGRLNFGTITMLPKGGMQ